MNRFIFLCILLFCNLVSSQQTVKLSREQAESIFLENNIDLICEKLNIETQKAEVIQAKLWPNPTFSISEINLWKTTRVENSPPFWGNFGRDRQIAFELEQLIETAGKRKKLIALEQIGVSKAEQEFEGLLRELKLELRNLLTELQYLQLSKKIYQNLLDNVLQLTNSYQNQLNQGIISKAEYMRLKAQELEIEKDILDLNLQSNEIQKELKLLLNISSSLSIEISDNGFIKETVDYNAFFIEDILQTAKDNRHDYKLALLEQEYSNKLLDYQKAQRIPDVNLLVNYDRNGNTMLDFVGVGLSFDLPIFNRNQGGVKKAKIGITTAELQKEKTLKSIENQVLFSYESLKESIGFLNKVQANYPQDLDLLLANYTKNFLHKNVSMLEYLDFMDAYINNKKIILETQKQINHKVEQLNYSLGKDL